MAVVPLVEQAHHLLGHSLECLRHEVGPQVELPWLSEFQCGCLPLASPQRPVLIQTQVSPPYSPPLWEVREDWRRRQYAPKSIDIEQVHLLASSLDSA